jgi:hypothetical protein
MSDYTSDKPVHEKSQDGRDGWEEQEGDDHKPRRLEEAVVAYLVDLENQMNNMGDEDAETKAIFVENVLTEIKQSTASAACDRRTNSAVERICYNASLENVIEILARFTGYAVFLARNRHASHVVQALLARLCSILKYTGIGDVDENVLTSAVLQFVRPILKEISWLMKEQAASHVIRSILCLLGGMPIVAEKKGKGSKHPHSVAFSETLENMCDKKRFYITKDVCFEVPGDFHEALGLAVLSLVQLEVAEQQDLIADWSSCAVFGIVIRIMANPEIIMGGSELSQRLITTALEWSVDNEAHGASVFYAMAGDKAGSYFLEAAVECCDVSFLLKVVNTAVMEKCDEYSADPSANFVLQTVLKRVAAELERGSANDEETRSALQSVGNALLKELASKKQFKSLFKTRGGIVLWMLELARHVTRSSSKDPWASKVGSAVLAEWVGKDKEEGGGDGETNGGEALASKLGELLLKKNGPQTAPDARGEERGSEVDKAVAPKRTHKNAKNVKQGPIESPVALLTARLVDALMKGGAPEIQDRVAEALSVLSPEGLVTVALSGPLSRGVLDSFFKYCGASHAANASKYLPALLGRLSGEQVVSIATHFIGQHIFRQFFDACTDVDTREKLTNALNEARETVNKTKEGRNSMKNCHGDMYRKKPDDWHTMMKRQARAHAMVSDLNADADAVAPSPQKVRSSGRESSRESSGVREEEDEEAFNSNNKRSAPSSDDAAAGGGDGDGDGEEVKKKKKKRSGAQTSRENWFKERQERLAAGGAGAGGGGRGGGRGRDDGGGRGRGRGGDNSGGRGGGRGGRGRGDAADFSRIAMLNSKKMVNLDSVVAQLARDK